MIIRTAAAALGLALIAACSQGSSIASPGASSPGTAPGGGTGGTGGGTGTATCPAGFTAGTAVGSLTTCVLSGALLTNTTLSNVTGIAYRIQGRVDVGTDVGADGSKAGGAAAVLTIEPGVTVFGSSGSDYIVVNRGSRLEAEGTASAPIIMTSEADIARRAALATDLGGANTAEWGGLVILGRGPINRCVPAGTPATANCENVVEGVTNPDAIYGGGVSDDDSGTLRYLQVRFAGFAINTAGNELNGITLAGVGSATQIDHVQVHNNEDDGIEIFGGTVNLSHVVLTGNKDDSLDTDNGWTGGVQFLVINQADTIGDNGFEMSSVAGVSPASDPKIANFTVVGNRTNAWRLNTGTVGQYVNGIVNYGKECMRWESTAGNGTAGYQAGSDPEFNSVLFDCALGLTLAGSDTVAATDSVAADANNDTTTPSTLSASFFPGPNEAGVTPFSATTLGGNFVAAPYIGAFGPTETPTSNWATGWTFGLFPPVTCPTGTTNTGFQRNGLNVCRLTGQVNADVRLTRGNIYEIADRVDIGADVGADGTKVGGVAAELTIEAGVTLYGNSGADYIVVNRGSKIFSNGTAANPVVFTSEPDLTGTQADAANATAEWGGLVILGRAPINRCSTGTPGAADCENVVEGVTNPDALYGGGEAADSSGSIQYTQVKYAGFAINTLGNELNGITLGGIGSGTVINHVQVHNNEDDGIEIFGGTVNLSHVVLTGNKDDSLDTDNGWIGGVQYLIIVQNDTIGDNGFEMSSVVGVTPASDPQIANFTVVGNRTNAFRLNTGTIGKFVNGVVSYGKECMRWETTAGNGVAGYQAGLDPEFNSVLFDCALGLTLAGSDTAAATDSVAADANNSTGVADTLTNVFVNGATETARTAFDATTLGSFFEDAPYIGAVRNAQDTWWQGWSCGLEAATPC